MTTNLDTLNPSTLTDIRAALHDHAAEVFAHATPDTTKAAYRSDWRAFERFCGAHGFPTLVDDADEAAKLVALFVSHLAGEGKAVATIKRRAAGVSRTYREAGRPSPSTHEVVKRALRGAARLQVRKGLRPSKARGALPSEVRAMIQACDLDTVAGLRDAALVVTQYLGTLRRSEAVALNASDVEITDRGAWLTLGKQKNHDDVRRRAIAREGNAATFGILERWKAVVGDSGAWLPKVDRWGNVGGRLSLAGYDRAFERIVERAGLVGLSTHSLRGGSAQAMARNGASVLDIKSQGDWQSVDVAAGYATHAVAFENSPTIGLLG